MQEHLENVVEVAEGVDMAEAMAVAMVVATAVDTVVAMVEDIAVAAAEDMIGTVLLQSDVCRRLYM